MEEYLKEFVEIAGQMGLEIVDVDFVNKDKMDLKIAKLDHSPVTLEDCVEANRAFGAAIEFAIDLDVSSAGAERVIDAEDYHTLKDQFVLVRFKNPTQGADYVEGTVLSIDEEGLLISYQVMHRHKEIKVLFENIAMCRLAVKV